MAASMSANTWAQDTRVDIVFWDDKDSGYTSSYNGQ